jgi:hypothetical protein
MLVIAGTGLLPPLATVSDAVLLTAVAAFCAVIESVPGEANKAAVTVAVSDVELVNVVVRAVAPAYAVAPEMKFVPVIVTFVLPEPEVMLDGLNDEIVGF